MPPEKLEVCFQLAKGLAHVHEKGFIYWDFKPQNACLHFCPSSDWWRKSLDEINGLISDSVNHTTTREVSRRPSTTHGPIIGWPLMKSCRWKKISIGQRQEGTVKSDVFSAGLIFGYHLLKGRHPYGSQFNIPANIVNDTPVNLKGIHVQYFFN
jgi:serine/threonine protein kinase